MKLYGFMQDKHWYEDVGHVFIGLIPLAGWIREHLQYPPGWPFVAWGPLDDLPEKVTQLSRVDDLYRDNLGYEIGAVLRTVLLVGLLIWRW